MSFTTNQQVEALIREATTALNNAFTDRLNDLSIQINQLKPPEIEPFQPVVINPVINCGNASLDLIKSLPEFDGDAVTYPAWRKAAEFAMTYYPENSEKFYVATGILRNKVVRAANTTLSSFNTVLNYKAILQRLDLTYADKRPLYVLENELSILRQGNSSITEFYDSVDKQLTLIINKQIMENSGKNDLIAALNERARDNALRVFVSGLRRPLCDILFSSKPKDLPNALAIAQELETNHRRYDFAQTFATGNFIKVNNKLQKTNQVFNKPIPMDIDSSRMLHRNVNSRSNNYPNQNSNRYPFVNPHQNNQNSTPQPFVNFHPSYPNRNTGAIPKRQIPRDSSGSNHSPFNKQQRINYMPSFEDSNADQGYEQNEDKSLFQQPSFECHHESNEVNEETEYEYNESDIEEVSDKINFLE